MVGMSEDQEKWAFRVITIFSPIMVGVCIELINQLNSGTFNWQTILSGAIATFIVAWANFLRAASEPKVEATPDVNTL